MNICNHLFTLAKMVLNSYRYSRTPVRLSIKAVRYCLGLFKSGIFLDIRQITLLRFSPLLFDFSTSFDQNELLICDACDKGFHSECHEPKLQEPVDRSMPWVCAACQKEGYSVAIGTLPGAQDNVAYTSLSVPMGSSSTGSKTGISRDSVNSTLEATPTSDANQMPYLIASAPTSSATCEPLVNDTSRQDESQTQLVNANDGTLSVKSSIKSLDSDSVLPVDVSPTNSHDTSSVVETDKSNPLVHSHSHISPAVAAHDSDSTQQVDTTLQSGRIPTSSPVTSNSLTR